MVEQARKNQKNPMEMFKEVTKDYKPEQMDDIRKNLEDNKLIPINYHPQFHLDTTFKNNIKS